MSFLALPFLLATLAAAVPVVLHMISRRRAKDLPFSTLRFLRVSVEKTRRRKRIHDLLLMLVRMAVLVLLAVALAKPTLTELASPFGGGGESAVVIVLDNSASMGTIDRGRVRFRTAMRAAEQIMDQLQEGDQVALLPAAGPPLPQQARLDRRHEKVTQLLGQWALAASDTSGVTYQRADLALGVRRAQKLLAESQAAKKQIYVLTDMQKLCWDALDIESLSPGEKTATDDAAQNTHSDTGQDGEGTGLTDVPVIIVDCHREPQPNVAITGVELKTAMPVTGQPVVAAVALLNASQVARQRHVELYVDGAQRQTSPVLEVPPGGELTHEITFTFHRSGLRRGEVLLTGQDGSKLDDRRFFAMQVDQGISVAVVKHRTHEIPYLEDTFYLEQALAPGRSGNWAIRLTTLTAAELAAVPPAANAVPLDGHKVVFCVNLPAPDAATAGRLADYVAGGGNLVWICGENVDPAAYNRIHQQTAGRLLPLPLLDVRLPQPGGQRDSWAVGFLDPQHPALGSLLEPASLYRSVLIYKHVRMAAEADDATEAAGARILARLDDEQGEPLLVERDVQRGKVLMLGTSVHIGWSNLPLRPIFLPLLVRLTFELAGAEQARHQTLAGRPLLLPLAEQTGSGTVEVQPPGGETIRRATIDQQGRPADLFRYDDTHQVGIYLLRLLEAARPTSVAYAVNLDPEETKPAKIPRDQLQKRFGRVPLVFADDPDDLSQTFALLREGKSLWELFLAGVLIALVFETFLANRLSPKKEEEPAHQPPPGTRRLARQSSGSG